MRVVCRLSRTSSADDKTEPPRDEPDEAQSADVYRPREGNSIPWSLPTGSGAGGFRIFSHFKMCKTEQNDAYATDEKPIAELVATGNFRKDRHASRLKPRAATGDLGEPPSELAADVRRAWEDIATGCHTAKIDGYFIEGHVPGTDIKRRLLDEKPMLLV